MEYFTIYLHGKYTVINQHQFNTLPKITPLWTIEMVNEVQQPLSSEDNEEVEARIHRDFRTME